MEILVMGLYLQTFDIWEGYLCWPMQKNEEQNSEFLQCKNLGGGWRVSCKLILKVVQRVGWIFALTNFKICKN